MKNNTKQGIAAFDSSYQVLEIMVAYKHYRYAQEGIWYMLRLEKVL